MAKPGKGSKDAAEMLAISALSFIAADPERLGRFLALTGIGPAELRTAAREPHFLAGVLEHVLSDERLLGEFAAQLDLDPGSIGPAHQALAGQKWEREVP